MDAAFLEKMADTTSSSEAQLCFEQFRKSRRLRKQSDQPILSTQPLSSPNQESLTRSHVRQNQPQKVQSELSFKFESEFMLVNDGNSFYRLVAIEHLRHLQHHPEELEQLCSIISRKDFDLRQLKNIPEELRHLLCKEELPALLRKTLQDLSQLDDSFFAESLINLMRRNRLIDFSVVAIYRLYTYIIGYRSIREDPMSVLLRGDEEHAILTYGCQVTHMVIKLMAESLCASISLYIPFEDDLESIRFGLDFSDYHNFELSVKLVESHYSLLVPKQRKFIEFAQTKRKPIAANPQAPSFSIEAILQQMNVQESILEEAGFTGDFFQQIYERMTESERRAAVIECLRLNNSSIQH